MNSISPQSAPRRYDSRDAAGLTHATPLAVRSSLTRIMHLLLLIVVLHQLIGSQFVRMPLPGDPPSWMLSLHEYAGLGNFVIVAAFWIWTLVRRGETRLGRLLPWFSIARLRDVIADLGAQIRRLARGRAPDDEDGALASATHGLGLLAVTAMAMTGSVYFFTEGTQFARSVLHLHRLIANVVWVYLFAHAGLAVLHHLMGSDILARMFRFGARRPPDGTRQPR